MTNQLLSSLLRISGSKDSDGLLQDAINSARNSLKSADIISKREWDEDVYQILSVIEREISDIKRLLKKQDTEPQLKKDE